MHSEPILACSFDRRGKWEPETDKFQSLCPDLEVLPEKASHHAGSPESPCPVRRSLIEGPRTRPDIIP